MKYFFLALFLIPHAFADQCAWNKLSDAKSASQLLKNNDIILWCQNCDEVRPSNIQRIKDLAVTKPGPGYHEISVLLDNGKVEMIDLAYTYVRTASDIFTNVAQLVGCPSSGATTFIQTGPGVKKVAHFYNKKGERVDVVTSSKEIKISEVKADKTRLPASK